MKKNLRTFCFLLALGAGSYYLATSSKKMSIKNEKSIATGLKSKSIVSAHQNVSSDTHHHDEHQMHDTDSTAPEVTQVVEKKNVSQNSLIVGLYDNKRFDPQVIRNQKITADNLKKKEMKDLFMEIKYDKKQLEKFILKGEDDSVAYLMDVIAQKKVRIEELQLANN